MISEWWASLPASTQIHYWGYICFILGVATSELMEWAGPRIMEWLEDHYGPK